MIVEFAPRLLEYRWIVISNFMLRPVTHSVRPTSHRFEMVFKENTYFNTIQPRADSHFFSFVDFDHILTGSLDTSCCVDIIGIIESVDDFPYIDTACVTPESQTLGFRLQDISQRSLGCKVNGECASYVFHRWSRRKGKTLVNVNVGRMDEIQFKGRGNKKISIELRNVDDIRLSCTLWGDYAKQLTDYTDKNKTGSIICLIRFAQIKEWNGEMSVSNSFGASKIYFNPRIPCVKEFRSSLPSDNLLFTNNEKAPVSMGSDMSLREEFLVRNTKHTLEGIVGATEEGRIVTVATVSSLDTSAIWYYVSCKVCDKKVHPYPEDSDDDGKPCLYNCAKCDKDVTDVVFRYLLVLHVEDSSDSDARFVLFDSMAHQLIRRSAFEVVKESFENGLEDVPSCIKELVGKELLFKTVVGPENLKSRKAKFTVQKLCDRQDIITEFKTMLACEGSSVVNSCDGSSDVVNVSSGTPKSKHVGGDRRDDTRVLDNTTVKKLKIEGNKEERFTT